MKLLKRILKILATFLALLILSLIVILWVDSNNTSYLHIDEDSELSQNSFLIKNANVIPMNTDTILRNKMILIKNGIIEKIENEISNENIPVFDANGKFITPGLIDMHVHVWDSYELGLYLANGVTAVRNLWGMPMHLRMKKDILNNKIIAPSFFTTGPKLTGTEFIGDDNLNLTSPEEAKEKIISYKERGYDLIKTYYGLDKEIFDAVIEQAKESDIEIAAHPSQKVPFSYHTKSPIKSIEHAEEIVQQPLKFDLDTLKLQPIIDNIASSKNTNYSPTLVVFHNIYEMMMNDDILNSESLNYINPLIKEVDSKAQFDRWFYAKQNDSTVISRIKNQHDFHITIVKKLHKAGVPIVCGTDAGIGVTVPGFSIHQELKFYQEAGLSNFEILKTATINAAQTHQIMNSLGTIEKGKVANLLVLEENPLKEISALKKTSVIFVQGRKLEQKNLDIFIEKAKNRKNFIASALRYVENLLFEK
ncbi:MAG: amidohydrolase family protein [Tenacibaculum sp.]|nr:amidohydrolase family protein [Tenacibaculum sp.]